MFRVKNGSNLSLSQIHGLHKQSTSVLRSAHIGNFNPATLFIAQEKFPVILDEHTKGNLKIFRAGFLRRNGCEECIADNPELPTTHMRMQGNIGEAVSDCSCADFARPSQFHFDSLRKLFSESVKLTSTFLLEQEPFVTRVLEALSENSPWVFKKYVREDGTIFNFTGRLSGSRYVYQDQDGNEIIIHPQDMPQMVKDYLKDTQNSILGNGDIREGVVLGTNADVLLLTLCEIYKGRNGVERYRPDQVSVIHFSGVEMMNYLIKNKKQAELNARELQEIYASLKNSLRDLLPDRVDFHLVPTDMIAKLIAVDEASAQRRSELLAVLDELEEAYEKEKDVWKENGKHVDAALALGDAAIREKIERLLTRADTLPRQVEKRVCKAKGMLGDIATNRGFLMQLIVKDEMIANGSYPKSPERRLAVGAAKDRLREISDEMRSEAAPGITQYDMLAGSQLFFPESARRLPQEELRTRWNRALRM
jgi:hypothetical protein